MRHATVLLTALALAGAMAPVASQETYNGARDQYPWFLSTALDVKRIESGQVVPEDPLPDAVVQSGQDLVLLEAPSESFIVHQFASGVTAFDLWPTSTGTKVVASTATGLELYQWNATTKAMESAGSIGSGGGVNSALELRVIKNSTTGLYGLTGLASDGRTLFGGGLSGSSYSQAGSFTAQNNVLAWAALQWDGVAYYEFAVQTVAGLMLHNYLGAALWSQTIPALPTSPVMTTFYDASLGSERLVWAMQDAPGNNLVYVLDQRFPTAEQPMQLGASEPGQLLVRDWGADSLPDLLISGANERFAFLFHGRAGATFPGLTTFDPLDWVKVQMERDPAGSTVPQTGAALGTVQDFDMDGDLDLLFASNDYQDIDYARNRTINEAMMRPYPHTRTDFSNGTDLSYNFQMSMLGYASYPVDSGWKSTNITAIETTIYRRDGLADNDVEVLQAEVTSAEVDPEIGVFIDVEIDAATHPSNIIYQLRFRPMKQGANGLEPCGPSWIESLAPDAGIASVLGQIVDPWDEVGMWIYGPGASSVPGFNQKPNLGPACGSCPP